MTMPLLIQQDWQSNFLSKKYRNDTKSNLCPRSWYVRFLAIFYLKKKKLHGHQFHSEDEIDEAVKECFSSIPKKKKIQGLIHLILGKFADKCASMLDCRIKANCLLVGLGPVGRMSSMGVFLRDPSLYLHEFWRKWQKTSKG